MLHWCKIRADFLFILSSTQSTIYIHVSAAQRYPPCPLCSRPGACLLPLGERWGCLGRRRWTAAGRRSLRLCWWTASDPARLWMNPPAPPVGGTGREDSQGKKRERGETVKKTTDKFVIKSSVFWRHAKQHYSIKVSVHVHLFKATLWALRTFHQPYMLLGLCWHCIDYLFRLL